jgi:hypothetical protein
MSNAIVKLILVTMSLQSCFATDLYSYTIAQTFTVGQPHSNVNAHPGNSPHTALADPNDCAPIGPLGGVGDFINYDKSSFPYYLWFQPPSFTTPASTCTLLLKFYKCTSYCYDEFEPVPFTIIN